MTATVGDDVGEAVTTTSHERVGVPWRNRTVQVVLAATLLAPLGVPLVAPALPVVRDAFGLTDAEASLLVSAYFVVGIVVSPFIGVLADRVGRKRVLVPALVVFSLTGVAGFAAPDFATLLALRAVQGTAAAALFVTTVTVIGDVFEGVQRNAVLGANVAVLSFGAATFPVLGGALAAVAWNAPFLAYALGLPVALFAVVALDEPGEPTTGDAGDFSDAGDAGGASDNGGTSDNGGADSGEDVAAVVGRLRYLRGAALALTPGLGALLATAFVTEFLLFGSLVTVLPFLLAATYGLAPLYIGLVITAAEVGAIAAASASGRLAGVLTNGRLIALGFVAYGVALVGVYVAPSPVFVAAAVVVFGLGLGASMPAVDAAVSDRVTRQYRAGLFGLRNSTTFLGRATGPVVFATAGTLVGYRSLLAYAAVAVFAVAVVAVLLTFRVPTPLDPEPSA